MKYLLLTYLIFSSFFSFAQETIWNTNIESIRSYSSPRPTNINNDNTLDIVFGGGVEGYPTPFGVLMPLMDFPERCYGQCQLEMKCSEAQTL